MPRYNEKLTLMEYRIAACDELTLEAIVWESREPQGDLRRRCHDADKAALREIDRLKLSGEYEAERARLASYLEPTSPEFSRLDQCIKAGELEPLNNFLDGLRSPDPEQRARFERLYEEGGLADKSPREVWHILICLEKAKKPMGRPSISPPWRNVATHLDAMRLAISGGATLHDAARQTAATEGRADQESRVRYLERLYRQKTALRE